MELTKYGPLLVRRDYLSQDMDVVNEVYFSDCYRTALLGRFRENELVVDVGAHIGAFARKWHEKNPSARIVCVEACPENLDVLKKNVGDFARVIHAACTYEPGPVFLHNSVKSDGTSTGGSLVVPIDGGPEVNENLYWPDRRDLPKVTLEDILRLTGERQIDLLKLDCEGSEFSILEQTPSLECLRFIVGEYHGQAEWDAMRVARFPDWDYGHMHAAGGLGIFHYRHPRQDRFLG